MDDKVDIAIIGAGFSGIAAAIRLKKETGKSFVILERASEVGGTWRENTYPGCACDIPSNLYSFSFDLNPKWSRIFPPQEEIFDYLKECAKKYDLYKYIRFDLEITKVEFNEDSGFWTLSTRADEVACKARVIVAATGPLNRPQIPYIDGMESYMGAYWHSSRWNHDVSLKGKRVAIIGTGASAIQVVPSLVDEVAGLLVFQRTPPWIIPKNDRRVTKTEKFFHKHLPFILRLRRWMVYWLLEIRVGSFLGNDWLNYLGKKKALDHIADQIKDEDLRAKVTPDYTIGCKRVLLSNEYYPALQNKNTSLITEKIKHMDSAGIQMEDGRHFDVDVIIFCTGFNASEMFEEMTIIGRKKRELTTEWQKTGPEAYLGLTVHNFPNLAFLVGPNTGLGHNSVIFMVEAQINYLIDYLNNMDKDKIKYFDVTEGAQLLFNKEIQDRMRSTVWSSGCRSWYQTSWGKNTTLWPGSTIEYRRRTLKMKRSDYRAETQSVS